MNFSKIIKKYRSLQCPEGYFDPCGLPYNNDKYFIICTERSVGKTTNILLFGMCANWIEGIQIQYLRQFAPMIERRNLRQLFSTIKEYGYIPKITEGHYTDLIYQSHGWYYCNYSDEGELLDRATDPFMMCLSIDQNELYKSTYNAPKGDILIFDEFISSRYPQDEFIRFTDVCKTIIRGRTTPIIFMLANTIDRNNQYFYEMEVNDIVNSMPLGSNAETITHGGTPIYVDFYQPGATPQKTKHNKLFFGFKNRKLGAITGNDWSITPMPHPAADDSRVILTRQFYILYEDRYINLELARDDVNGIHIIAHMVTKGPYKDSIIYSMGLMMDWRFRYKFGHTKADKLVWTLYERKKFFYTSNAVGALVEKYYQTAKEYRRLY